MVNALWLKRGVSNMGITKFGEFTRDLRIEKEENLRDMAKKLEVSSAFLSAVENGNKKIPKGWLDKISDKYHLTLAKRNELKEIIFEVKNEIVFNLDEMTKSDKNFALVFARSFEELTNEEKKKIHGILTKKRKNKNKKDV